MTAVHAHGGYQLGRLADHLLARIARAQQKGLVDIDDLQLGIGDDDTLGVLLDRPIELAQLVLADLQCGQHLLAFLHAPPQAGSCLQANDEHQHHHAQQMNHRQQMLGCR